MRSISNLLAAAATLSMLAPCAVIAAELPDRPEKIEFKPLDFTPPRAEDFRHTLPSGVPVYLAPSDEFPLVNIVFSFKGGEYLEPDDKVGLAGMTGAMMRRGGTTSLSAEDLDERLDFLAAIVSTNVGSTQATASLNCLTSNLDEAMSLFMDVVRNPGFQEDKVRVYRDEVIESMKQRNDDATPILGREWASLMYGEDHFSARQPTIGTINNISVSDMRAFHDRIFNPNNLIIAVSGDFDEQDMLRRLEAALSGWEKGERMPDPPAPVAQLTPGVYRVEKDIPQGKVALGHRSVTRDDPDYFPLVVMNDILGGGGFTSRITKRVRSDEGLAYSAGSMYSTPVYYPGEYRAFVQSKSETVALSIKIILEEMAKMREAPVSQKELETSVNSFIETFPRTFESKPAMLGVFVSDEWTGRDSSYWQTYRDKMRAVTAQDVQRVASEHLHPDNVAILVVGDWADIAKGDLNGRASMKDFFNGEATRIPLRDPLTLEPLPE